MAGSYLWVQWARFDAGTLVWSDVSGNNRHGSGSGGPFTKACETSTNREAGEVCSVRGGTNSQVVFGAGTIPPTFTICSVARYNGPSRGRIFVGDGNWLHGHWYGQVGVAYYEGWMTSPWTQIAVQQTDWIVMCGQNAAPYYFLADRVPASNGGGGGAGNRNLGINSLGCCGRSEASDWAVAEVSVWNRALSSDELEDIAAFYA